MKGTDGKEEKGDASVGPAIPVPLSSTNPFLSDENGEEGDPNALYGGVGAPAVSLEAPPGDMRPPRADGDVGTSRQGRQPASLGEVEVAIPPILPAGSTHLFQTSHLGYSLPQRLGGGVSGLVRAPPRNSPFLPRSGSRIPVPGVDVEGGQEVETETEGEETEGETEGEETETEGEDTEAEDGEEAGEGGAGQQDQAAGARVRAAEQEPPGSAPPPAMSTVETAAAAALDKGGAGAGSDTDAASELDAIRASLAHLLEGCSSPRPQAIRLLLRKAGKVPPERRKDVWRLLLLGRVADPGAAAPDRRPEQDASRSGDGGEGTGSPGAGGDGAAGEVVNGAREGKTPAPTEGEEPGETGKQIGEVGGGEQSGSAEGGEGPGERGGLPTLEEAIFGTPLDLENQRVVRVDVERTRPDLPQFKAPAVKDLLTRVLTYHCKEKAVGYKQGMHEVLAPFVALSDPPLPVGDIFLCYGAFIERFLPYAFNRDKEFLSLQICFRLFRLLLLYHHPRLCRFLDQYQLQPELYATPWFLTLFASNLDLTRLYEVWDFYLYWGDPALHHFVVLAFVIGNADAILQAEEANLPETMCRLSVGIRSVGEVRALLATAKALMLNTPKSFRRILRSALYSRLTHAQLNLVLGTLQVSSCIPVSAEEVISYILHKNPYRHLDNVEDPGEPETEPEPELEAARPGGDTASPTFSTSKAATAATAAAADSGLSNSDSPAVAGPETETGAGGGNEEVAAAGGDEDRTGPGEASQAGAGEACRGEGGGSDGAAVGGVGARVEAEAGRGAGKGVGPGAEPPPAARSGERTRRISWGRQRRRRAAEEARSLMGHRQYIILDCRPRLAFDRCRLAPALHLDPALLDSPDDLKAKLTEFKPLQGLAHFCLLGEGPRGAVGGGGWVAGRRRHRANTGMGAGGGDLSGEAMGLRPAKSPSSTSPSAAAAAPPTHSSSSPSVSAPPPSAGAATAGGSTGAGTISGSAAARGGGEPTLSPGRQKVPCFIAPGQEKPSHPTPGRRGARQ